MGKIKSAEEQLRERGIIPKNVDWGEIQRSMKEAEKRKRDEEQKAREKEERRIADLKCPSCKSKNKKYFERRDSNGIIGPGYRSWIVDAYYVCQDCGTMFKDLQKNQG